MPDQLLHGKRHQALMTSASNAHTVVSVAGLSIAGFLYLLVPGALAVASVGILSPHYAPVWAAAMGIGGLLAFIGIVRFSPRAEVIGLGVLGAAVCFAGVAITDVREVQQLPLAVLVLQSGLSCVARIGAVVHLDRVRRRVAAQADRVLRSA